MHGLVVHLIESFLRDRHGPELWNRVARSVGVKPAQPMQPVADHIAAAIICNAASRLAQSPEGLLEDLGGYIMTHDHMAHFRGLLGLRSQGVLAFLQSLCTVPEQASRSVPGFELPRIELFVKRPGVYGLVCSGRGRGYAPVIIGMLRAVAEEMGETVLLDHLRGADGTERVSAEVLCLGPIGASVHQPRAQAG